MEENKMGNRNNTKQVGEVIYRRAKVWEIALSSCSTGIGMSFYILLGLASYVANAGYGIMTAVVGIILTATRILDGVTDPFIAILIDKTRTRFGKLRIWMIVGWAIEALAVFIMYVWASGKGHGIFLFVLLYVLYIIGYTMCNVTSQIIPPVLTNDPKQRPMIGVWCTIYNYVLPMVLNVVIMVVLLPQYGNQYTIPMLAAACKVCVGVSAVALILCCVGVSKIDKIESFEGIQTAGKTEIVEFKDMWSLLKTNRALQMFIISEASDKLASQTASQAIISTMLFGIIIGNMQLSSILQIVAMVPSIIFAFVGAKYAGKHGNKESMVVWSRACIIISIISLVFFIIIDPKKIATGVPFMIIYVALTLILNGTKMCVTTSNNAMMADIIDYELDRSGKYLPAAVTGTYSFVDKLISSLGAVVATGSVALLGYTSTMPQPTDAVTTGIFWVTMLLYFGLPIAGWVCTLVAMKFSPLSRENMVLVQQRIRDKKEQKAGAV